MLIQMEKNNCITSTMTWEVWMS